MTLADFSQAFLEWLQLFLPDESFAAAVDAKTSCQGLDIDGEPVQLVNLLIHELKLVIAQWSVRGEKTNEPCVLKNHLAQLREQFPLLKLITGDAINATRPLAQALLVTADDGMVPLSKMRYFVTSILPKDICAAELLATVRRHWQIVCDPRAIASGSRESPTARARRRRSLDQATTGDDRHSPLFPAV